MTVLPPVPRSLCSKCPDALRDHPAAWAQASERLLAGVGQERLAAWRRRGEIAECTGPGQDRYLHVRGEAARVLLAT